MTQIVETIAKKHPILNNSRFEILEPIALEKVKAEFERAKKNKLLLTARDIENLQTSVYRAALWDAQIKIERLVPKPQGKTESTY